MFWSKKCKHKNVEEVDDSRIVTKTPDKDEYDFSTMTIIRGSGFYVSNTVEVKCNDCGERFRMSERHHRGPGI